jgi:FO synthase
MEENISRAAGATHGQAIDVAGFSEVARSAGRHAVQRTTLYEPAIAAA